MEIYNMILQAIGSVGFPIVACAYLAYVNTKQMKDFSAAMNGLEDAIVVLNERLGRVGEDNGQR